MIRTTINTSDGSTREVLLNPDRCLPSRQLIRQQLDAGKLGDVGLVRVHRWEPPDADNSGECLELPESLVRDLDIVLWLTGQVPNAVHAVESSAAEATPGRFLQVHLGFPSGAMALLDYSNRLPPGDGYQSLSVIGSAGAAYADDHQNMQLVFRGGRPQAARAEETGRRHADAIQQTIQSLAEPVKLAAHEASSATLRNVAAAVRQSLTSIRSVGRALLPVAALKQPEGQECPSNKVFRCAALSAVKHDYVARGLVSHPRFELVVVADDPQIPDWGHERNQQLADSFGVPYVRDIERALREFHVDVAIVSPEAERHCDLSIRAAALGVHVVQDKPLTTQASEADRLVAAIERSGVHFLMWNRNFIPAVLRAREQIAAGEIGRPYAVHLDFYFAKDAGPPKGSRQPGYPPINWQSHLIAAHVDGSDGGLGVEPMGELAIEGIYPLGYLRLLTGADVRRVFARSASHFHQLNADNGVEDLASVTLELDNVLLASLAIGRIGAASHPSGGEIKLQVLGTDGALVVSEARPEVGVYYRQQPPKEFRQRRIANDNDYLLADNFAHAIDTNTASILDARASRAIFATVAAALESARTGQVVEVRG
jgi:predicted dehydrogenase